MGILGGIFFQLFFVLNCYDPLIALNDSTHSQEWGWQSLDLSPKDVQDLVVELEIAKKAPFEAWEALLYFSTITNQWEANSGWQVKNILHGLTRGAGSQALKKHHVLFQIHPEILHQILWSLHWLLLAANSDLHPYSHHQLENHLKSLLSTLPSEDRNQFSSNFLGCLGELRVAAYLVSQGFTLVGTQVYFFEKGRSTHAGEFDILLLNPEDPEYLWAVEVKTNLSRIGRTVSQNGIRKLKGRPHQKTKTQLNQRIQLLEGSLSVYLSVEGGDPIQIKKLSVFALEPVDQTTRQEFEELYSPSIDLRELPPQLQRSQIYPSR